MDVFGLRGMVFDPSMGSHVAHAMKMSSIFDGNGWGSDIPDEDSLFKNLDSFRGGDRAVYFPAREQCAGRNYPLHDGKLAYD